ncbi:MAG: thioredoxin-dependent thiol peroxidase [Phycisphaerales bacterium]|nr:thioredoxin-dependent thiol peroxidase [Phycisphaerales bacterium]
MPPVEPGKKAPAFTLKDQEGKTHKLADYAGSPLILYFYPKDDTSGCTDQACQFRDTLPKFNKLKAKVLGVSIMDTKSKAKFAAKNDLNFPILADDAVNDEGKPDPKVAQKYGVWAEKSMYGRQYMGIERTTFLIGPDGKVAKRWDKVKVPGHAEEVLEALKQL